MCSTAFACHASGTLDWLCYLSDKDRFKHPMEARKWLEKRYNTTLKDNKDNTSYTDIKTYDEIHKIRPVKAKEHAGIPNYTLAPYQSGKATYKYFYKRGFTKETLKEFKIGYDKIYKTVTVPVFYENNKLAGIIGRYIKPRNKAERYKVYDSFNKSFVTFPQNKLEVIDDTIILVEGLLDALWMHQLGFTNTQALLSNKMTKEQAKFLKSKANKFIRFFDNDDGGDYAKENYNKRMKGVKTYDVKYPEGYKDPQELSKEQIEYMLQHKVSALSNLFKPL